MIGRPYLLLALSSVLAGTASAQLTLTGAVQFSTNSSGAFNNDQYWNTLGGDHAFNLWFSLNADGSAPLNGSADTQAPISLSLSTRATYTYYLCGQANGPNFLFNGLNFFFDGNNTTPGISVYQKTGSAAFAPDSSSTVDLAIGAVPGVGTAAYRGEGSIAVLTGYRLNTPGVNSPNLCTSYTFAPGTASDYLGEMTLSVFPAAVLSLQPPSGEPGMQIAASGSGFLPFETVEVSIGKLGSANRVAISANASGAFTVPLRVPQTPLLAVSIYALGEISGNLGLTHLSIVPGITAAPGAVAPGGSTRVEGVGFASQESVSVYLNLPRQLLGTATANNLGSFRGKQGLLVTIPSTALSGVNVLIGIGAASGAVGIGAIVIE